MSRRNGRAKAIPGVLLIAAVARAGCPADDRWEDGGRPTRRGRCRSRHAGRSTSTFTVFPTIARGIHRRVDDPPAGAYRAGHARDRPQEPLRVDRRVWSSWCASWSPTWRSSGEST